MAKLYGRWGAYEARTPEEKARARRQEKKRREEKALLAGAIERRRQQEAAELAETQQRGDEASAVVEQALTEKIQRQDRFIAELQAELQRTRQVSVETMLGQLRLRQAVLLYVGQDADNFAQQLAENFGGEVARAVSNSLFVLDNAPVPPDAREAIRKATNHGMNRW